MNSWVCIDASVVLSALAPDTFSDRALALWEMWQRDNDSLIAPTLLNYEVASTLRRLVYSGLLTDVEGEQAFQRFLRMDIHVSNQRGIIPLAWEFAKEFGRPRAYDTSYLAVAYLRDCEFWTADERLYNAVRHKLTWVKWLGQLSL